MKIIRWQSVLVFFIILTLAPTASLGSLEVTFDQPDTQVRDRIITSQYLSQASDNQLIQDSIGLDDESIFGETVVIPMASGGEYRRGSVLFELNETYPYLTFQYDITDPSPVLVTVQSAAGSTFNELDYILFMEILDGNDYENFIDFTDSQMAGFPLIYEYGSSNVGNHYVNLFADLLDFEFGVFEPINLNITIDHFAPGKVREGGNNFNQTIQSEAYDTIMGIQNYLDDRGYIDLATGNVDPGEFDSDDPDFAKGIGLSIYGLLKSSEYISKTFKANQSTIDTRLTEYLNTAASLFDLLNDSMREPTAGYFFYRNNTANDYTLYLADNAYAMLAAEEIINAYYGFGLFDIGGINFDISEIETIAFDLGQEITKLFEVGSGDYREMITITGYIEAGAPGWDGGDGTLVHGSKVNLEALSMLAESFFWDGNYVEMEEIVDYIENNLKFSSIPSYNLLPAGIYADYYDISTGQKSDTISMAGNALYISHLSTYAKEFDFYNPNPISTDRRETLEFASEIAENMLSLFQADNSVSNLLYSDFTYKLLNVSTTQEVDITELYTSVDPSLGNDISVTVPAGEIWTIHSIEYNLTNDGTTIIGNSTLEFFNGTNVIRSIVDTQDQAISTTITRKFYSSATENLTDPVRILNLGNDIILPAGSEIRISASVFEAGDDFSSALIYLTRAYNSTSFELSRTVQESEKKISTLDNSLAIFALNRLAVNWEIVNPPLSGDAVLRTWKIRSINGLSAIGTLLFDQATGKFFPQFDDNKLKFDVDDSYVQTNQFVANMYLMAPMSDLFPAEMDIILERDIEVDTEGQITLVISQIGTIGTWIWWDPFKPFSVDAEVIIEKFDYQEKIRVDLSTLDPDGPSNLVLVPFFHPVEDKGEYEVVINLSIEGKILLTHTEELRALGSASVVLPSTGLEFATDDSSFTGSITVVDENGLAVPNIRGYASLGIPLKNAPDKYLVSFRTDSSGQASLKFNVDNIEADGIINRTEINQLDFRPRWVEVPIFMNFTNSESFNLVSGDERFDARVVLAYIQPRVSPTNLEITQGSTESYTFSVSVLNQELEPVANARVDYELDGIFGGSNSVFSDADGEASITISATQIVQMAPPDIKIAMNITQKDYPTRNITRTINILENRINILANPVQAEVREKTFSENKLTPIDVEVATEDMFGRSIAAYVSIGWFNESWNDLVKLEDTPHIAPYTFQLDPSGLTPGEYKLLIFAWKDGLTSSVEIIGDGGTLSTSQTTEYDDFFLVHIPEVIERTITVTEATFEDQIGTVFAIYGAYVLVKVIGVAKDWTLNKVKKEAKEEIQEIVDDIKGDDDEPEVPPVDPDHSPTPEDEEPMK